MKFSVLIPLVILGCKLTDQGNNSPQYLDSVKPGHYQAKATCELACEVNIAELTLFPDGEMAGKTTQVEKNTLDSCLIGEITGSWSSTATFITYTNGKGKSRSSCDQDFTSFPGSTNSESFPIRRITAESFEQGVSTTDTMWVKWNRI